MTITGSLVTVADALTAKLVANKESLGIEDVFYGDQNLIPRSPAVCVETGNKARALAGATRRTDNIFVVYILVYHSEIRSPQSNRRAADALAESIETLIHQDPTLGGLVTHGYVTSVEPGYVDRPNTMRACRITYEGQSRTLLPT